MAGISFRGRKDHEHIDASFYLHAGEALGDVSTWMVGDVVGVCFDDQADIISQIDEHRPGQFKFYASSKFLQIPCVVVKRHHSVVWKSVGRFDALTGCCVVLEAESGYWEDVLRWVVTDQLPPWIPVAT